MKPAIIHAMTPFSNRIQEVAEVISPDFAPLLATLDGEMVALARSGMESRDRGAFIRSLLSTLGTLAHGIEVRNEARSRSVAQGRGGPVRRPSVPRGPAERNCPRLDRPSFSRTCDILAPNTPVKTEQLARDVIGYCTSWLARQTGEVEERLRCTRSGKEPRADVDQLDVLESKLQTLSSAMRLLHRVSTDFDAFARRENFRELIQTANNARQSARDAATRVVEWSNEPPSNVKKATLASLRDAAEKTLNVFDMFKPKPRRPRDQGARRKVSPAFMTRRRP
jgi:hypothetical protein